MARMSSNDMMGQFRHHVRRSSGVPKHHGPSEVRQIPAFVGGFLSRAPAEDSPAEEATESPAQESAEDAPAGGTTGA